MRVFGFLSEQTGHALPAPCKNGKNTVRNGVELEFWRVENTLGNVDKFQNGSPFFHPFAHHAYVTDGDGKKQVEIANGTSEPLRLQFMHLYNHYKSSHIRPLLPQHHNRRRNQSNQGYTGGKNRLRIQYRAPEYDVEHSIV